MPQSELPGTPKEILRANFILTSALIIGVVIFFFISLVVVRSIQKSEGLDQIFLAMAGGIAFICLISALKIYGNRIKLIKEQNLTLYQKLFDHRAALIIYFALCEGPALFALISFMLTGNYWFMIIVAVMLLAMIVKLPSRQRVINELQLDWKEQQEL